jgi:hypothetical protein
MCLNLSLKHLIVLCWWECIKHFTPCFEQTPQGPFGQSQQLSNSPSTVLISSTSNSLMSASVKPSTQQIGAIGTKGAGPYQQSALPSAPEASQVCADVLCAFAHYSLHQTVVPHVYSWLPKKCSVTMCSWDSANLCCLGMPAFRITPWWWRNFEFKYCLWYDLLKVLYASRCF